MLGKTNLSEWANFRALAGADPRDGATAGSAGRIPADYTAFLDANGLRGARIGVIRNPGTVGYGPEADAIFNAALGTLGGLGATLIDPLQIAVDPPGLRLRAGNKVAARPAVLPVPGAGLGMVQGSFTVLYQFRMQNAECRMQNAGQRFLTP